MSPIRHNAMPPSFGDRQSPKPFTSAGPPPRSGHLAQAKPPQSRNRLQAGPRRFLALHHKMLAKEPSVFVMFVKMLRRQHCGNDLHLGLELYRHQGADDRIGNEFMPINAALHHKTAGNNGSTDDHTSKLQSL